MATDDDSPADVESGHLGDTTTVTKTADGDYADVVVRDEHRLRIDEPEWLPMGIGDDHFPAPVDHLVIALVSCQVEVLDQALRKARVEEYRIDATAEIDDLGWGEAPEGMPGNTAALIDHIRIDLTLDVPAEYAERAQRCLDTYDDGCIVGRSYRAGVDYTPETELQVRDED